MIYIQPAKLYTEKNIYVHHNKYKGKILYLATSFKHPSVTSGCKM